MVDRAPIQPTVVYSREEAAEVLGISLSTLKKLIAEGHLRPVRPDGLRRVLITGASLLRMLKEEPVMESAS